MMHVVKIDVFVDVYQMIVNLTNVFGRMKQHAQAKVVKVVTLALPNPSSATMEMKCCGIQRCEIPIPPIAPVDPIIIPTRPPVTTSSTTTSTSTLAPVTTTLPGKCVAWLQTNKCNTTEKIQCTADCKKENGADYEGFILATDKTLSDTSLYDACCENRCVCRRIPDDCKSYKCFWADETTCTGKGGKVVTLALPNPSSATKPKLCNNGNEMLWNTAM